jgi:hypothetical protein
MNNNKKDVYTSHHETTQIYQLELMLKVAHRIFALVFYTTLTHLGSIGHLAFTTVPNILSPF